MNKDYEKNIGKAGEIWLNGFTFNVKVLDVKYAYGVARYLVTPVSGSGQQWVNADRVTIEGKGK